jgi:hypothetical protein
MSHFCSQKTIYENLFLSFLIFYCLRKKKEEYLKLLVVEDVKTKTKMSLDHKTIFYARICIRGIKISGSIFPSLKEDLCKPPFTTDN